VLYHNFCCTFSCYIPPNLPGYRWLNCCVNLRGTVQWSRLALSKEPNWVGDVPLTWGWKQIQFPKRRVL
jgi:hypothetical protein